MAGSFPKTSTTPGTVSMEQTSATLATTLLSMVDESTTTLGTTEMLTSSSQGHLTTLFSTLGFTSGDNVTSSNSAMPADSNSSLASSLQNSSSQEVDLEALNLSMTVTLIPTVVYLALLMVVGMVGNTVVLLVYYRRFKPSATRTYVLSMCVCDMLANIFSLPSEIIDIRYTFTFDLPWVCRSVRGFNSFVTLTSAFVLVAVARDRFNKICHPLEKQWPMSRIRLYVLICALASLALSVVFGALNGSHTLQTGVGNSTGVTCSVNDVFLDTLFPLIYNMTMALAFILCVVIMTVSYIRIALELWRHKKKQQRISGPPPSTSASHAAKGPAGKVLSPIVEDTSSGPIHDSHLSDTTKSASTAELIPLKTTHATGQTPKSQTPASGPEKQVLLLSIKNLNYEGPTSSVEDSDEGRFSMETTSTSADLSKDGHIIQVAQDTRGDPQLQTQIVNETQDEHTTTVDSNTGTTSAEREQTDSAQNNAGKQPGATPCGDGITSHHHDSRTKNASSTAHTTNSQQQGNNSQNPNKATTTTTATARPDTDTIQPADDVSSSSSSPPTPHHRSKIVGKSPSLLQRLLTPRRRGRQHGDDKDSLAKPTRCQIPKKRGTVKSIPSSTTLMMFVLTATFVVNYLPHLIVITLRAMDDSVGKGLTGPMLNAYNIALRSYFMNCAANSLVYGFCSARFRQECRNLFARK